MNRRSFLKALSTAAAAMTFDPERLLWVPGQKMISIPAPVVQQIMDLDLINAITMKHIVPHIRQQLFESDSFLGFLSKKTDTMFTKSGRFR